MEVVVSGSIVIVAAYVFRDDPLQHFSWWVFAGVVAVYTSMTFTGFVYKQGALVFSKQNAKPPSRVLSIHAEFLVILLVLMWLSSKSFSRLPGWMTDAITVRGVTISICDLAFVVGMAVLLLFEKRLIFAEVEGQIPDA